MSADFHNFETSQFANPSRMALIARDDESNRTFAFVERLAVTAISHQNCAIFESSIEFGQRKKHSVSIRRDRYHSQSHIRAFQLFAKRRSGAAQNLRSINASVPGSNTMVVVDADRLPFKCRKIGRAELEMSSHLAADAQHDRWRRLGEYAGGGPRQEEQQ